MTVDAFTTAASLESSLTCIPHSTAIEVCVLRLADILAGIRKCLPVAATESVCQAVSGNIYVYRTVCRTVYRTLFINQTDNRYRDSFDEYIERCFKSSSDLTLYMSL